MQIGVIGINHKSADLQFRELFAKICQRRFDPSQSHHPTLSYILLSTCNRTEIYFQSNDLAELHSYLLTLLRQDIVEEFEHKIYSYFGTECFIHLAMVTSGLDSALIAETEIQGQVKKTYEKFSLYKELSSEIHFLFQKCLKIGKQIRQTFSQKLDHRYLPSIADVILKKTEKLLGDVQKKKFLFVGASEINHKIISEFKNHKVLDMTICNRSQTNAESWALEHGLKILPWQDIAEWVDFDIILFGTKASDYLIHYETHKKNHPSSKILIDLSVPRNVDPQLAKSFHLFNVDELYQVVNQSHRFKALQFAHYEKKLVAEEAKKQVELFLARSQAKLQWHAV